MEQPVARTASILLAAAMALVYGCSAPPPVSPQLQVNEARSQKLMALAAEEAGKIGDPDMRLTRQLNLADMQIERDWVENARKTLAAARTTLSSSEAVKLNDHARISGWVSISELSRRIHDTPFAAAATEAALRELDKIEDQGKRCEYVMGLANELQYIKGKPAAAALLAKAGPWTKWIDNLTAKRQALIAFATALFNLNDFDAGQKMLEHETDAAWRSDVLAGMAQLAPAQQAASGEERQMIGQPVYSSMAASVAPGSVARSPATEPFYGKSLNYNDVFKNQKNSNTTKD